MYECGKCKQIESNYSFAEEMSFQNPPIRARRMYGLPDASATQLQIAEVHCKCHSVTLADSFNKGTSQSQTKAPPSQTKIKRVPC